MPAIKRGDHGKGLQAGKSVSDIGNDCFALAKNVLLALAILNCGKVGDDRADLNVQRCTRVQDPSCKRMDQRLPGRRIR